VIANPGTVSPAVDQAQWLDHIRREPDPARRMRRRLIDDTCVHATDLDEGEAQWLSQRVRGDDGAPLALAFGLKLERRAEGAAFVVPDEAFRHPRELGPLAFPVPGTVAHAALLLCDHAAAHGHTDSAPGPGWRGLVHAQVLAAIAGFAAQYGAGRGGWRRELADDPAQLAERVSELLGGLNLLRREGARAQDDGQTCVATWWFAPVTGRWAHVGTVKPRSGRSGPPLESIDGEGADSP
jgi:hypothetical protein